MASLRPKAPLVSICIPNLNKRPFLEERMETLLAQTCQDWEIIICDSCSTDGSWEYFQKFKNDPRIHLYQVPRAGLYAGWNECLRRATAPFTYIATSDDTASPTLLEALCGKLLEAPDVDMATCNYAIIDAESRTIHDSEYPEGRAVYGNWLNISHRRHGLSEFVATSATNSVWTTTTAFVARTTLFQKAGLFLEGKGSTVDFQWALTASLFTDSIHVPETLATFRTGSGNASMEPGKLADFAMERIRMIGQVCSDHADRLPQRLSVREWKNRLLLPAQISAFNCLRVYPRRILEDPEAFLNDLGSAALSFPSMTMSHLAKGGMWRNRPTINLADHVDSLLKDMDLPPICRLWPA